MSSELAISVRGVGKRYTIAHDDARPSSLGELVVQRLRQPFRRRTREHFWALRDLSFDVARGEVVGIIGRNGAGKSTLLKILSRITEPTTGEIQLYGRIGSLLEVGTGFHRELTGRENIYLNGSILGMRRSEIDRNFDEIVDFAGTERFLDTPVKRYSSGMFVRLAFAVAAHLNPEILIVDEVLSVGDVEFQRKCLGKMEDVARQGRTVLFVSHNMAAVEALCSRGLLMEGGRLLRAGALDGIVAEYHRLILGTRGHDGEVVDFGDRYTFFRQARLLAPDGLPTRHLPMGSAFRLRVAVEADETVDHPIFVVMIDSDRGERMLTISSPNTAAGIRRLRGPAELECAIPMLPLAPGGYWVKLGLWKGEYLEQVEHALHFTVMNADTFGDGWGADRGVCVAPSEWSLRAAGVARAS